MYYSDTAKFKLHKNGQLINTITEVNNVAPNLNQINIGVNIDQQGLNKNQSNNKDMFQIKIMKNSKDDNSRPKDIKRSKTNASNIEKMEDE